MSVNYQAARTGRGAGSDRSQASALAYAPIRLLRWAARRVEAAYVRIWIDSDERHYKSCQDSGMVTEAELQLLRHQLQRLHCRLMQLESR